MDHKKRFNIKSIMNFLLGKLVIVGLLIFVQIVILMLSVIWLADYITSIYVILTILSFSTVVWLVSKNENPSYKLAWVILIMVMPIFGGVFYLMFGNKGLPKKLARQIREAEKMTRKFSRSPTVCRDMLSEQNPHLAVISDYLNSTTEAPLCAHTQSEYFSLGEHMWVRMLEKLSKAEHFIFMEYFILQEGVMWDPIFKILKEKADAGLDVRFMFDDLGSIQTLPHNYAKWLNSTGIKCVAFNAFKPHLNSMLNYRDHRKITVIDGNIGFCGGINIADEYINNYEKHGHWKDTGVMLQGDAVWNLTSMFLSLWHFNEQTTEEVDKYRPNRVFESDGFVQPFGDSPLDHINVSEDTYMQIINHATRYVYITTPYLILDNEMITALQMASRGGIDVRIMTPHVPDKKFVHETTQSFYQTLLDAGVRIYEYTPGFVHSKMYVSDDNMAVVGTANMDYRSFYLHFECGVCFYNARIVADVRDDILHTLDQCIEIPADYQKHVPTWRRITRAFLRLFSPMM